MRARAVRRFAVVVFTALGSAPMVLSVSPSIAAAHGLPSETTAETTGVIVRYLAGYADSSRQAVVDLGGTVGWPLDLISGFVAQIPESNIATLQATTGIESVTVDGQLSLEEFAEEAAGWIDDVDLGMFSVVNGTVRAPEVWSRRDRSGASYTGTGIGVAVIDSGVVPVEGLTSPGKVINGPDLSFESQNSELRHLDTFGHGTHIAGIIAGRDSGVAAGAEQSSEGSKFVGVAPGAHIISLKVAASDGATDVSQVIAAIDWVVEHRNDPGLNIRVLNLSFGTEALQSYQIDPLAFAVEQAWLRGIVVVVAAGNGGQAATSLNNPATDPYVISVGASDNRGTLWMFDDVAAQFSSVGGGGRVPDILAPGRSVVSLRSPGSWIDDANPIARVGFAGNPRLFRGSGTSQSAAVVSGAVALILDERPSLTPDQVKFVLRANARRVGMSSPSGAPGLLDLHDIQKVEVSKTATQSFPRATGTGSLELARGGNHVVDADGVPLIGEFDIFGQPWVGSAWARASAAGKSWDGGLWNGSVWAGDAWNGTSWTGKTWRTDAWVTDAWSGKTWRDDSWSGKTWRDETWSGKTWRDGEWLGTTWRDDGWAGKTWRESVWSGVVWR